MFRGKTFLFFFSNLCPRDGGGREGRWRLLLGWRRGTLEPNDDGGKARDNDSSRLGGFCETVVERVNLLDHNKTLQTINTFRSL